MHHAHLQCENTQIEPHIDTHICLSQSFPLINHLQRPSYTHTNTHPRKRHTHTDIFSLWYTYIKYAHARFPPSFMCACGHVCCHVFVQFGVCVCVCVCRSQLEECADSVCVTAGRQVWNPNLDELKPILLSAVLLYWHLTHISTSVCCCFIHTFMSLRYRFVFGSLYFVTLFFREYFRSRDRENTFLKLLVFCFKSF